MKKLFLATTALVVLAAGSAAAADLPVAYKAPRPFVRPARSSAVSTSAPTSAGRLRPTGPHRDDWIDGFGIDNAATPTSGTGWIGGVQGGYNWQSGCTLFGVEIDWSWAIGEIDVRR